jgi:heme-degrading monooxygenase HmoA
VVTVGMYYDVIPGQSERFVASFNGVLAALGQVEGHRSSFLYRRVDDPDSYAIISEWDSQEAFLGFIRSEEFRNVTSWGRAEILRNAPRHKIYPRAEDLGRGPAATS